MEPDPAAEELNPMSDAQDNIAGGQPQEAAQAANVELFDFYVAELEAYLDGELASEEASQVRRRLMQEEAYAAALGRLHACRIQRVEAYKRIEHEETDLEAAARIAASARRLAKGHQSALVGAGSLVDCSVTSRDAKVLRPCSSNSMTV